MTSNEEATDSDGTSADTILRELCMLRCTSCSNSCTPISGIGVSQFNISIEAICQSPTNSVISHFERLYEGSTSSCLISSIKKSESLISSGHLRIFKNYYPKFPFKPSGLNLKSKEKKLTALYKQINEIGEGKSDNDLSIQRENATQYDCLLNYRCASSDCACDKHFDSTVDKSISLNQRKTKLIRLKSFGSQVTETSLGLKLIDWSGYIVIQEDQARSTSKREIDLNRTDRWSQCSWSNKENSDYDFQISGNCKASFYPNSSSNKLMDLNNLSISAAGMDRDKLVDKSVLTYEIAEGKASRGQIVDTYGKLLHKIEKLKRMTSWKSKGRKNKNIFKPDESIHENNSATDGEHNYCCKSEEKSLAESASEIIKVDTENNEDFNLIDDCDQDQSHSKQQQFPNKNIHEVVQQVLVKLETLSNENQILSMTPSSMGSTIDCSEDEQSNEDNKSKLDETTIKYGMDITENRQRDEVKQESEELSVTRNDTDESCCCMHGEDPAMIWRGRQSKEQILDHLREINRILESDSSYFLPPSPNNSANKSNIFFETEPEEINSKQRSSDQSKKKNGRRDGIRIYWAVTKVTVYPDSCRTYEVMRLSKKKPAKVPSSSETVFVLLPNK